MDTAHDSQRTTPDVGRSTDDGRPTTSDKRLMLDLPAGLPISRGRRFYHPAPREWTLGALAGRIFEISDSGTTPSLTAAASLILQAQQKGDPVAWIAVGHSIFFPPDLLDWGIDLEALPVLRVLDGMAAARAADQLLRSGAFGLVVLDLQDQLHMRPAVQSRLAALAKRHQTLLLCLTRKKRGTPSLGSLVSLHGQGRIQKTSFNRFSWEVRMLKDKQGAPGWSHTESCRGSDGLC